MRRIRIQQAALHSLKELVTRTAAVDSTMSRAIRTIQEIELVSRGYRLSAHLPPITRIERSSQERKCIALRLCLHSATTDLRASVISATLAIAKSSPNEGIFPLDLNSAPRDDDLTSLASLKEEINLLRSCRIHSIEEIMQVLKSVDGNTVQLGIMKVISKAFHAVAADCRRCEQQLDAMMQSELRINPEDTEHVQDASKIPTSHSLIMQQIMAMDHSLQAVKLKLVMSAQHVGAGDDLHHLLDTSSAFQSIRTDLQSLLLDWETCHQKIVKAISPSPPEEAPPPKLPIHEQESLQPEQTFIADQDSEYIVVAPEGPDDVYEDSTPKETKRVASKLSREERIKVQKANREAELVVRAERAAKEQMVHELKNVLVRRKPDVEVEAPKEKPEDGQQLDEAVLIQEQ
ncbi:hypothetical protein HK097_008443 [Rhizophlyctis rosea]|uniref:Vezatin n=1 Tax=Rhizophlyctis rosea TaxID=64517 RepID=A0AAD5SLK1_9FUNG|nr:hypothetical protein HK097_008443 [Rhizophlyctis rosea]